MTNQSRTPSEALLAGHRGGTENKVSFRNPSFSPGGAPEDARAQDNTKSQPAKAGTPNHNQSSGFSRFRERGCSGRSSIARRNLRAKVG